MFLMIYALFRKEISWENEPFDIPADVYADFKANVADRGENEYDKWDKLYADYKVKFPELTKTFKNIVEFNVNFKLDKN